VIWWVPGFTVEKFRSRLRELHDCIQTSGPFVAHSTRHLIEARKPSTAQRGRGDLGSIEPADQEAARDQRQRTAGNWSRRSGL